MAKHTQSYADEQQERFQRNKELLHALISHVSSDNEDSTQTSGMVLALERMLINRTTHEPVPYEGAFGVERLMTELAKIYRGGEIMEEGHIIGIRGALGIEGYDRPIALTVTLGTGAQITLRIGPVNSIQAFSDVIAVFDRQMHLAYTALGQDYEFCAQGYNPYVRSPSDIVPLPLTRSVLENAYLSRTGPYSRDALRCTAKTVISLPVSDDPVRAVEDYRLFAALSPILSFLTDNSLRMRGGDPHSAPRMTRMYMWQQTDPARCGIVPGTLSPDFGFETYERWLEQIAPILFLSDEGVRFSLDTDTCSYLMRDRTLSSTEMERLITMAWPDVRWNGRLELHMADSLPPRLACSYAALIKGLLSTDAMRRRTMAFFDVEHATDGDIYAAWNALRAIGWDARVYGHPIGQVANELSAIASIGLKVREERRMIDALSQLWEVRMVPRDTLLRTWDRTQPSTPAETAIKLYGEGAVIPFEELAGEPPAGSTASMPALRP